jgi:hypothetical protein
MHECTRYRNQFATDVDSIVIPYSQRTNAPETEINLPLLQTKGGQWDFVRYLKLAIYALCELKNFPDGTKVLAVVLTISFSTMNEPTFFHTLTHISRNLNSRYN